MYPDWYVVDHLIFGKAVSLLIFRTLARLNLEHLVPLQLCLLVSLSSEAMVRWRRILVEVLHVLELGERRDLIVSD